jgi:threonine dehydratase
MHEIPDARALDDARAIVARDHPRTPLFPCHALSRDGGPRVFVKYENHSEIRSFKGRGALGALARLSNEERARGVVVASTGNHGQAVPWAGRALGVSSVVVVPASTPQVKRNAIISNGGHLIEIDGDLGEAGEVAKEIAASEGRVFIDDGNDAGLMAGAATVGSEILEDLPDAATIVVPVGGGNLIAGVALAARRAGNGVRVVGVQSDAAQSVYLSWQRGEVVEAPCATSAGGLATRFPGDLAFSVIKDCVDDMLLVSEGEIDAGVISALETTGQVVEGAAAASFAALERHCDALGSGDVVLVLTGGNIEPGELRALMNGAGV